MKPTDDDSVMADGDGTAETSPFQTVSDVSLSRSEKYRRYIDRSIAAPVRILWDDWRGKIGIIIVFLYILMGTLGVVFIDVPSSQVEDRFIPPFQTLKYPLGTDISGQGVFALIVHATPPMLKMIFAGGVFAIAIGSIIGMVSGYKGGTIDQLLMVITDSLMTLPGLPLVIIISFLLEPRSPYVIGVILAINNWTGLARALRSQMLTLRDAEYVEAARIMGDSLPSIVQKDILPNLMPYIAINFVGASRRIIFESVALYYLGVLPTSVRNWGLMINTAYTSGGALYSTELIHWLLAPILAIVLLSLGLVLLSQAADRVFNPRIRASHAKTTSGEGAETAAENNPGHGGSNL